MYLVMGDKVTLTCANFVLPGKTAIIAALTRCYEEFS